MDEWYQLMRNASEEEREQILGVIEAVNMDSLEGLAVFQVELVKLALRGHLPVEMVLAVRPIVQDLQATMFSIHQKHGMESAFRVSEQRLSVELTRTVKDVQPTYYVAQETVQSLPDGSTILDGPPVMDAEEVKDEVPQEASGH